MKIPTKQRLRALLGGHTRSELRQMARNAGIRRGRNKTDTINNIIASALKGKVRVLFYLR